MDHREDKTTNRMRGTTRVIDQMARDMRAVMTPAEQVLWEALKGTQLNGLRFRAQHPIGPFILDFYCSARKLVIEIDGPIHEEQAERDADRTRHLNAYSYRMLRFTNEEVLTNLPSVLEMIREALMSRAVHEEDRRL